jgi:hypothetical protein
MNGDEPSHDAWVNAPNAMVSNVFHEYRADPAMNPRTPGYHGRQPIR